MTYPTPPVPTTYPVPLHNPTTGQLFVIYTFDGGPYEAGDTRVAAITTSQVVASMALQAGWLVYSNLPVLTTTQEFIRWAEENQP